MYFVIIAKTTVPKSPIPILLVGIWYICIRLDAFIPTYLSIYTNVLYKYIGQCRELFCSNVAYMLYIHHYV